MTYLLFGLRCLKPKQLVLVGAGSESALRFQKEGSDAAQRHGVPFRVRQESAAGDSNALQCLAEP